MSVVEGRTPELGAWSSTSAGEPFGEWELPGMGEAGPRCGEVRAAGFCDKKGHVNYERHLCGRRECPECWSNQWAGPRTESVVSRLAAARHAEDDGLDRRTVHAAVSPPEDSINTIRGFYDGRSRANEIAKEHGIRGGVVVAHGYRALDETKDRYRELKPDLPLWRWIRGNDREWREQVYWSPHYHIIGLSRDTKPADDDMDGWVFKKIRSLAPYKGKIDREGIEDMASTVRYLLSHATFPANENRQAVTWFGSLHGTNFDPEDELSKSDWGDIQEAVEEIVGHRADDDEEGGGMEQEECSREGCESVVHEIWGARDFLDQYPDVWSEEQRERVRAAYDWATGRSLPPPGLKRPRSREDAEEALEAILVE